MIAEEQEWRFMTISKHLNLGGFSFIELLITLSIIGILSTIAYPCYMTHLHKIQRLDGQMALLNLAYHLQKYYNEHQEYLGATMEGLGLKALSSQQHYAVSISELRSDTYLLTATPVKSQANDQCAKLTLTQLNEKGPSIECWQS